ncbi:MAG: cupredoxin domain-containing protein [Hyphomicrobiaceae bacterium]|nr:cupredoxin domain-containing protein [Hyphomicrobiaceae bacterium]
MGEHPGDHSAHRGHASQAFEAGEPGDAAKPLRTVEIVMTDGTMSYAPNRIEARKGEQVKFVIWNEGQVDHEILIDSFANNQKHKAEMEKNPELDLEEPNGARLKPAAREELIWRFTRAGTFGSPAYCRVITRPA